MSGTVTPDGALEAVPLVVLAAGRATRYGGVKPLAAVGPQTEAILDVLAGDALAAGFGSVVLVLGPETRDAIRTHVEKTWPRSVAVSFCTQREPRGTVDAVLSAKKLLEAEPSFGIANADDLPGRAALSLLAHHLVHPGARSAVVCFSLSCTLIGDEPVTRGICDVDADGLLRGITERRGVTASLDGSVRSADGLEPETLDPDAAVSMNLFGFRSHMLHVLDDAMHAGGTGGEVLLPDVVDGLCAGRFSPSTEERRLRVLRAQGRCVGVTHAADAALVHDALAGEVSRGERPADIWAGSRVTSV